MKKLLLILTAAFALSLSCAVSACSKGGGGELVSSVKMSVNLRYEDGKTRLEWETVDGVDYEIYRAPSAYAEYLPAGKGAGSFEDDTRNAYYKIYARDRAGNVIGISDAAGEEINAFGKNVFVFAPTDDAARINEILSDIYSELERAHFTDKRYAVLFKPGDYGNISIKVPYFTTFSGLGAAPDDVKLKSLSADGKWNGNALINFWRGVENISFSESSRWAVSQGTFLRSVNVVGDLYLYDYDNYNNPNGHAGNEASGGFIANSAVTGSINSGSQQQWFTRNSVIGGWNGGVWNMVFAGVNKAPSGDVVTSVPTLPVVREKPHLTFGENGYELAVPTLKRDCGATVGYASVNYPIETVYFASPERDTAATVNAALEAGKHVVFQPGVYKLSEPIRVLKDDAVLLGLGLATLLPTHGNGCIEVGDVDGVSVCGLLFDAGAQNSEVLLKVGEKGGEHAQNPNFIFDCFFRIGGNGSQNTYAETSLEIISDDTVVDNVWLWRADHGSGVGWDKNNGDYGAVIRGDGVKCYGLFAEHYKKNDVNWLGNDGYLVFYQSELAYDVPSNEVWVSEDCRGYPSFRIADGVSKFEGYGMGIYTNFLTQGIILDSLMRVPEGGNIFVGYLCGFAINGGALNLINDDGISIASGGSSSRRSVRNYGNKG